MSLADSLDRARAEALGARKPALSAEKSAELTKSARNAFPGSPVQPAAPPVMAAPAPAAPTEPSAAGPTRGGAVTGRVAQVPSVAQPSVAAPAPPAPPPAVSPVAPAPTPTPAPVPAPAAAPSPAAVAAPPAVAERRDAPLAAAAPAARAVPPTSADNRAATGLVSRNARPPTLIALLGPEAASLSEAERNALQVLDSVTRQRWQRRDERDAAARSQPGPTAPAHWRGLRVEADAAYWTEPDGTLWVAPLSPAEATRLRTLF